MSSQPQSERHQEAAKSVDTKKRDAYDKHDPTGDKHFVPIAARDQNHTGLAACPSGKEEGKGGPLQRPAAEPAVRPVGPSAYEGDKQSDMNSMSHPWSQAIGKCVPCPSRLRGERVTILPSGPYDANVSRYRRKNVVSGSV